LNLRNENRPSPDSSRQTAGLNQALPLGNIRTATLICFEDVFPHLVRRYVAADTDFLVNLTNDGWFGESAAQWQHAANAAFRAVENGRPLLRCCNNGLTCWVDSSGRIRDIFRDPTGSVYGPGFLTATLPLPAPEERRPGTFYTAHGDWFGWACAGAALLAFAARIKAALQARRAPS
jgi:apolipoprotein N-acyltransferase